jgi:hypothetical protein
MDKSKITFKKPSNWEEAPLFCKISYYSSILDSRYSIYVDKIEAKKIVEELTNGEIKTAKIVKELKNADDLIESDINPLHILKASHGCGWNLDLKTNTDLDKIRDFINKRMHTYKSRENFEKQYNDIEPRFFIEEKINDFLYGVTEKAIVFMIRCIHGKPISIGIKFKYIKKDKNKDKNKDMICEVNLLYDMNWNKIKDSEITKNDNIIFNMEKPKNFDIMIRNAEILSQRFEFVRIDYYIDKKHDIYFSEFTFSPNGGYQTFNIEIEKETSKYWT